MISKAGKQNYLGIEIDLRKARWYEERLISYMLEHPSEYLR